MKLFFKKFFYSVCMLTALTSLSTLKVEGMNKQKTNSFASLQDLAKIPITLTLITPAFNATFYSLCTTIVQHHNPHKSKRWLTSKTTRGTIDKLVEEVREQINASRFAMYQENFPLIFQTFDNEIEQLHKKIAMLVSLLNYEIVAGKKPSYFNDAQLLQSTVEQEIMLESIEDSCTIV